VKLTGIHSHRFGEQALFSRGLLAPVKAMLDASAVVIGRGAASQVKAHIQHQLVSGGWALDVPIAPGSNLTLNALKDRVGLQTQTGNAARAAYDLLKFQAAHQHSVIDAAILILPTHNAAKRMGSNLANYDRVVAELTTFGNIIFVPILVIGFA
jgi:hypothetical protein